MNQDVVDSYIHKAKSPTFLVFALTGVGYVLSGFYEMGYLSYYDINFSFAQITSWQLIASGLFTALIFNLFITFYQIYLAGDKKLKLVTGKDKYKKQLRDYMYSLFAIILLTLPLAVVLKNSWVLLSFIGFTLLVFLIEHLFLLVYFIRSKDLESALLRFFKRQDALKKRRDEDPTAVMKSIVGIILCFMIYSSFLGYLSAMNVELFATSNTSGKEFTIIGSKHDGKYDVVVRNYGELILIKEFDTKAGTFEESFRVESVVDKAFIRKRLAN